MLLVGTLHFVILLSVMHIISKFRLKLEIRSFSSLMWELSEESLRCNTAKSHSCIFYIDIEGSWTQRNVLKCNILI